MAQDTVPPVHARLPTERLPLVIGITGHRDVRPEDVVFLTGVLRATFVDIREKYAWCPLSLLSPLAEGGDRLAARTALEMQIPLIVPLPLPADVYEQDFDTPESRAEFQSLLAQAAGVIPMPLVPGNTAEGILTYGEERNRQYAMVGAYIARHSNLFIALWDGVQQEGGAKPGGTAEIVRFRLEGAPEPYDPPRSPLTFANNGPVYQIVTPRLQDPTVASRAFTRHNLVPAHRTAESFHRLYERMAVFNQDVSAYDGGLRERIDASKAQLLGVQPHAVAHAEQSLTREARRTLEQYAVADTLAVDFGKKTLGASANLFGLVFVAALCFNIFHSFPHVKFGAEGGWAQSVLHMPWFLVAFLAFFLYGSAWLQRRATKGDYQNKYQDCRALAEGLRIQFFWRVAGLTDSVADHYLRKQQGELEWIRSALRSWEVMNHVVPPDADAAATASGDGLGLVRKRWVLEQRNYFASKARREQEALEADERRIDLLLKLSLGLTAALAAILILPHLVHVHALEALMHVVETPAIHGTIMLVIVMLLVAAGLRHGYNQQLARSEHAKQYSRMSALFDIAQRRLDELLRAGQDDAAEELLKELGEEALEENGDWVLLHRERPLEVPHAG